MALDIILFIAGAALVILGADWLVDGASGIARRFGLSEFLIGATIVGIGTSMPELVVSTIGAIEGNADITIGNVTGSNMFNTLLILGVTALLMPIAYTKCNIRRDVPLCIAASLLLMLFSMDTILFKVPDNTIVRWEGVVLLLGFAAYLWYSFKQDEGVSEEDAPVKKRSLFINILLILTGLAGLIFGGNLFVDSATGIARKIGVSDAVIAITIMAGGTSLPELATCIVAAAKRRGQMALGNVLGSNIANILLIVGTGAVITPLNVGTVNYYSAIAVVVSSLLVMLSAFTFKKMKLDRVEGVLYILIYAAYIWAMIKV